MLDELEVATRWNRQHLGGRLTDRQLVDMATSVAAHAVGVEGTSLAPLTDPGS
jgi:hypothetical protein